MISLIVEFDPIEASDGRVYAVRACGRRRIDGLWDGWLAFFTADGTALRTGREILEATPDGVERWADGLGVTDLEQALRRARPATPEAAVLASADELDLAVPLPPDDVVRPPDDDVTDTPHAA